MASKLRLGQRRLISTSLVYRQAPLGLSTFLFLPLSYLSEFPTLLSIALSLLKKISSMAPQDDTNPDSPLSPRSVRNDEKRPYHYEQVSVDDRLSKASVIDQVRVTLLW